MAPSTAWAFATSDMPPTPCSGQIREERGLLQQARRSGDWGEAGQSLAWHGNRRNCHLIAFLDSPKQRRALVLGVFERVLRNLQEAGVPSGN